MFKKLMKLFSKSLVIAVLISIGWGIIIPASAGGDTNPNCPGWICAKSEDLAQWTAKMDIYWTLWMAHKSKSSDDWSETSVMTFIQDIIYAATFFIWSVVTAALIVSWLLLVFSWADSSLRNRAKSWFKYALIWLVIVSLSVIIVRAVQFIAKWWS